MGRVLNYHYHGHPQGALNIMRPSRYANPYIIGRDGDRAAVLSKYRRWLWCEVVAERITMAELAALLDSDLICCCAPAPCHGDILMEAAQWAAEELEVK